MYVERDYSKPIVKGIDVIQPKEYAPRVHKEILVIGDASIDRALRNNPDLTRSPLNTNYFDSVIEAIYHLSKSGPSYTILIVNEILPDEASRYKPAKSGTQFISDNLNLLKSKAKLLILTAFDSTLNIKEQELNNLNIPVVRNADELVLFINQTISLTNENKGDVNYTKLARNFIESQIKDEGISPHIASDLWTTEDTLGYEDYAYGIYKFMTNAKTKPPLTISIQAAWGGGKTSLMRMIRKFIDPDADSKLKEAAQKPNGRLKLKEAVEEIKKWINGEANRKPFEQEDEEKVKAENRKAENFTVWFNAWKYENTNQVWAGLIDTVMQQVAARLPVKERELFWLRLNLKRVDTDKIRKKIHDRIFNYFLKGIWYWGIGLIVVSLPTVLVALGQQIELLGYSFAGIGSGISLSAFGTLLLTVGKYIYAKKTVEEEPAVISLNDYLEIPDYSSEIGFIHRAEIDLKHVLESIPEQYKPLVIFIDDLDRCSPTKISQVVEAVNLFLAGDFPHCFFVIGMDTEMVAAALQSAHKDMIANLPSDLGIPIGWRFMDKFVQLPFLIPPCERFTTNYVDSLFNLNQPNAEQVSPEMQKKITELIQDEIKLNTPINQVEAKTKSLVAENRISKTEALHFRRNLQSRLKRTMIDKGVKSFTDKNNEIRELMNQEKAFNHFTGNPRELKRFVNAFRFNYFLWWAQKSQGSEVVTVKQLLRWTILSMKWAEVIRWLRRGDGSDWTYTPSESKNALEANLVTRLKLLEDISLGTENFTAWKKGLEEKFQLDVKATTWANDEDLFQFLRKEKSSAKGERLSDGIGKGIW